MRAERLLTLLLCLQHHGKMTTRQLAEKVEVSERTIARDMEALSAAGIPVFAFRGALGGWSLSEGYRTNLTGLKIEEIQSLLLMNPSGIMNDLGLQNNFDNAFLKLFASLPPALQRDAEFMRDRIHVDGAGWHQSQEAFPYLGIIQEAIWNEKKLIIDYPKDTTISERLVDPLGLVAKATIWYLVALTNGEMRSYRISRIHRAQLTDDSFTRPNDFQLAAYWEQSTQAFRTTLPYYPAVIKIQEQLLPRLHQARYVKVKSTSPTANSGWLVAAVDFHTIESACDIILSYSPYLKVEEPHELQLAVISRLQASLALYDSGF
ncbi:WYL domain-containing protein [Paenibacillus sp. LMG 31456]|uniref:WYL domain-containing protein n=1 Tax=Paenibacillus foliorum TaxID=2654974 RepID=A0A972H0E2_9BACL|nr:WYL domain-containing protein [Paenibacillus foliorum]NOU93901.1 WYL domain-containing protein [Paenibacillus foliorum]